LTYDLPGWFIHAIPTATAGRGARVSRHRAHRGTEDLPAPDLTELSERLRPAFERHGCEKAIVFGSMARGDASRRSDLDLILVKRTNERFIDRYRDVLHDLYDLAPERESEALIYIPAELARLANRPFIAAALREGKVIYESP
jgi:predicted nucleotidyltransferase